MQEAAPGSPDCSYHSLSLQDTGELFSRISHSSRCQRGGEELVEERSFPSPVASRSRLPRQRSVLVFYCLLLGTLLALIYLLTYILPSNVLSSLPPL